MSENKTSSSRQNTSSFETWPVLLIIHHDCASLGYSIFEYTILILGKVINLTQEERFSGRIFSRTPLLTRSVPLTVRFHLSKLSVRHCLSFINQVGVTRKCHSWIKHWIVLGTNKVQISTKTSCVWINNTSDASRSCSIYWNGARGKQATFGSGYLAAVFVPTVVRLFPRFEAAGLRPPGLHVPLLHHERLVFLRSSLSIARPVQVV